MGSINNLLITGSNGFVGQSFLNYLEKLEERELPKKIYLVNRSKSKSISYKIRSRTEIISLTADLTKEWKFNTESSHILNLAGDGSRNAYTEEAAQNFIKICENLEIWALSHKPKVIVHASSGACFYGDSNNKDFINKSNLILSRIKGEKILARLNTEVGTRVVAARLFTFIGPNILNKLHYAATVFIRDSMRSNLINVTGNPYTIRSYMHESTMSHWLANSLLNEKIEGIFSVGSSNPVTIRELAEFISSKTNAKIIFGNAKIEPSTYLPNNESNHKILGLSEGPKWQDSVEECINIYRKRGMHLG